MDQRVILHKLRIFAKNRTAFRAFHVRFEGNRAIHTKDFQKLRHKKDRVEIILLFVLRPLEHFTKTARDTFNRVHTIADEHGAHGRAADGGKLRGCRVDNRLKITTV